ncbi:hypothetical protein AB4059_02325 [Lysobacter sp. 2RAF19]
MTTNRTPEYAPFIPKAREYGIARSKAIELANAGLLDTFLIGRRRFVFLDSLRTLPERLAKMQASTK